MSSEPVITLKLQGTSGGAALPEPNEAAVFENEPVRFELDPPPPAGFTPVFFHETEEDGVTIDWEQRTLTASKRGMARIRCSWSGIGISYVGRCWLVVLPTTARPAEGVNVIRHLLVIGPDKDFYLFSPHQPQWPVTPFMPASQAVLFDGFWGGGEFLLSVSETAGVPDALFVIIFKQADGTQHSFFIINLPYLLLMLKTSHREYEFRSLLLGGPDHRGYLIPWTGEGHPMVWPTVPTSMASNPFVPRENGASVERYLQAKVHDDQLGDVLAYDLAELLLLLNREDGPRVVASLYSRSDQGAYSYRFFQVGSLGIQALDEDIQQDELWDYQGGALRAGVLCSRVSTSTRDTYLYNINSYADAAEAWAPSHDLRNELLVRTPGPQAGYGYYYCFFNEGHDDNWGDSAAGGNTDMAQHLVDSSKIPFSILLRVNSGLATGMILDIASSEPALRADVTSEFISCYLLNLSTLLPRLDSKSHGRGHPTRAYG
ncbi:hypothetical protein JQX13_51405 [Archangium violaceum]|uniref:hypothetical protein n=1 Tax=Archangium violaceum TaxID=83451 RepID=UPI00193C17BD|nr:hypothetical protein [Archangium violaceum]QRK08250.1 hypothetical protein JQX13_51405 [Archangium violaceum]